MFDILVLNLYLILCAFLFSVQIFVLDVEKWLKSLIPVIGGKSGEENLGLSKGLSSFSSVIGAAVSLWEIFIQLSDLCLCFKCCLWYL